MALLGIHGGGPVPTHVHGAVVPAHVAAGAGVLQGARAAHAVGGLTVGAAVEAVLAPGDGLEREELAVVGGTVCRFWAGAVLRAGDLNHIYNCMYEYVIP